MKKTAFLSISIISIFIFTMSLAAADTEPVNFSSTGTNPCSVTFNQDLSFTIPNAIYDGGPLVGQMALKLDVKFFGEQNGQLLWQFADAGNPPSSQTCSVSIAPDLSFTLEDAVYDAGPSVGNFAFQAEFKFSGEQNGFFLWYLADIKVDDEPTDPTPDPPSINCGAYVAPRVWKEFDCYNLAAIGKTTEDDPFTPSWRLIGGYWQWGQKGPDSSVWLTTNNRNFAHGPTGPSDSDDNSASISGWAGDAPDGAWSDSSKTANDPCPAGYRVPTRTQWQGVVDNNTRGAVGTWSTTWNDHTNYSSARFFGNNLMLPAAGYRDGNLGSMSYRGDSGYYWSSSEDSNNYAWYLYFDIGGDDTKYRSRRSGLSVRCVADDSSQLTRLEIETVLEEAELARRDTSVISADIENRLAKAVAKANEADFQTKVLFNAFFMASPETPRDHLLNTYHALTKSFEIAAKKNAEIIDIHEQIEALLGENQRLESNALNVNDRLQWYLDNFRNTTLGGETINIATIAEKNNISHERVHVLLRTQYGVIADQEEATAIQYEAAEKTAVEIKQASDAANNVLSVVSGGQAAYGAIKAAQTGYTAYKMYRAGNLAYNTTAHIVRTQGFNIIKGSVDGIFGATGGVLGLLTDPNISETLGIGEEINEKFVNANNIFSVLNTAKTLVDARSIFSIKDPFTGNSKLVISDLTNLTKFVVDLEPENLILGLYQTKNGGLEFKSEILKKGEANEQILAELLQQRQLKPEDLLPNGQYVVVDDEDGTEESITISASGVNALLTNLDEEDRLFDNDGDIVNTESPVDDLDPCRPFGLDTVVQCGTSQVGPTIVPVKKCIDLWGEDRGWCCSGSRCNDPCAPTNPPGFEVCSGS